MERVAPQNGFSGTVQRGAKYWRTWFTRIGYGDVKQTNLSIFYHLGAGIKDIDELKAGMALVDAIVLLIGPYGWLKNFLTETEGLDIPDSRSAAEYTIAGMDELTDFMHRSKIDSSRLLTSEEVHVLSGRKDWFEKCFDREYRYLDVFTVTPKGIYDTRLLMSRPEEKFSPRIRKSLPNQTLEDLKQAARCLAFDIPTACAFHICRATEALMLAYYEVISGHPWNFSQRNWNRYIEELVKEGATKAITDRLDEIRAMDRNAYTHPERNVTLEESPIQFELCTGVMYRMADEIDKKKPDLAIPAAGASAP